MFPRANRLKTCCGVDLDLEVTFDIDDAFPTTSSLWQSWKSETEEPPSSHGFDFWIEGRAGKSGEADDCLSFCLRAQPQQACEAYSLLVDYAMQLSGRSGAGRHSEIEEIRCILIEHDLISKDSHAKSGTEDPYWLVVNRDFQLEQYASLTISVQLRVREILSGRKENLFEEGPFRDFALLVQDTAFYLNVNYLADLGSDYFVKIAESHRKGVKRTVLLNRSSKNLTVFFDGLCTYRKPVVTCRNFDLMLQMSNEFKVAKGLRACERYLLESSAIHPIRKLEYAAEYGFGILGDTVIRSFGTGIRALEALHEYCDVNRETLDCMHPDVLEALNFSDDFVVL